MPSCPNLATMLTTAAACIRAPKAAQLQDAHNLAWKLAAVLKGTASPKLLESYQAERKPVAQANTDLSVANWHEAVRVPRVLGLDPRAANLLNAVVSSGPMSLLPQGGAVVPKRAIKQKLQGFMLQCIVQDLPDAPQRGYCARLPACDCSFSSDWVS